MSQENVTLPANTFADRASATATEQWEIFGKQTYDLNSHMTTRGHKEEEDGWYQRVGVYLKAGLNIGGLDGRNRDVPWSAAFISWVMRTAGAGKQFNYNEGHSHFIHPAIIALQKNDTTAGYWCYRLTDVKPGVGDILGFARQAGIDYDHQNGGSYKAHSDLVIEVNADHIQVIGGNVGDSVTSRPIPLNESGHLWQHTINGELLFGLMKNRIV